MTVLALTLAKGAIGSLSKRGPYDGARLPARRLELAGARVDGRKLAAYAEVCGFRDTEHDAAVLPVSYPHLLGFPLAMRLLADRAFPFPLLGLVHTGIEITQHRPLLAADRPDIRVRAEGLTAHRRGSTFDVLTEARLAGTEAWRSRSTYLYRHHRPEPGGESSPGPSPSPRPGGRTDEAGAAPLPARTEWDLPGSLGRRYAAASGDRNPIHLHSLTARPFGFRRAIAHGMWLVARCLAEIPEATGHAEQLTVSAEFRSPVLLPATVVYGARDGAFELRGGSAGSARLHLTGRVSSGTPASGSPAPPSRSS